MNKRVTAREFLHGFASLEKALRPGESVVVTRRGKPIGHFMKQLSPPTIRFPDFEKEARKLGHGKKAGNELFRRMMEDEAIS